MKAEAASAFDSGVGVLLAHYGHTNTVSSRVFSTASWGIPLNPAC
jgi:hypothetical protein